MILAITENKYTTLLNQQLTVRFGTLVSFPEFKLVSKCNRNNSKKPKNRTLVETNEVYQCVYLIHTPI